MPEPAGPTYREVLEPPPSWWVAAGGGVLVLALVLTVAPLWALVIVPPLTAVAAIVGLRAYALRIVVDDRGLQVGPASLPWTAIGSVQALDSEAAALLRGRDADPRAYHALRSYVPTAVRIGVADPKDPTPYWYVSTGHPDALAEALDEALDERQS